MALAAVLAPLSTGYAVLVIVGVVPVPRSIPREYSDNTLAAIAAIVSLGWSLALFYYGLSPREFKLVMLGLTAEVVLGVGVLSVIRG